MPEYNFGYIHLSDEHRKLFLAISNDSEYSKRSFVSQIMRGHIIRFKQQYLAMVSAIAKMFDLSQEQAFERLAKKDILGVAEFEGTPIGICLDGEANNESSEPMLNVGSFSLTHEYLAWCDVLVALSRLPKRKVVQSITASHLNRWRDNYKRQISYRARMHGLSYFEALEKLSSGQDLGEIINPYPVDFSSQKTNFGMEEINVFNYTTSNFPGENE